MAQMYCRQYLNFQLSKKCLLRLKDPSSPLLEAQKIPEKTNKKCYFVKSVQTSVEGSSYDTEQKLLRANHGS